MRTISIPEARKYCKERGWSFRWVRQYLPSSSKVNIYHIEATKSIQPYLDSSGKGVSRWNTITCQHESRQYAIQAVYQAVRLFEETTLKAPSAYIKRTKTRPTHRAQNIAHP